jgi:hypothetical protein
MSFTDKFRDETCKREEPDGLRERAEGEGQGQELAPELDEALRNFRLSVHAWSEAALTRSRTPVPLGSRRSWRLAAGWALGCALIAGGVSGGVYEHHHRQEMAKMTAARAAEQQRLAADERAREEEELLARVDSDVAREVPSAMEPLAQLMAEDETR